ARVRTYNQDSFTSLMYRFHLAASTLFKLTSSWRSKCGNDSEALYIYIAFLLALAAEAVKTVGLSEDDLSDEVTATLSAFSISSMTGIPRETVRRKLRILVERGMITPGPGSAFSLTLAREAIREFVTRANPLETPYDWDALQ
ncbi:MAG TPA: hypothetical protein PKB04_05650, partial [Phenylobacterium sp.]|nr:hypothetical protein [Phenylobacterium sp.]